MKKKKDYSINDRVIEKMKEAGMDEMALAMATGLPKQSIYNLTNKEVKPTRGTIELIAKALKANFSYLFTGTEREEVSSAPDNSLLEKTFEVLRAQLEKKDKLIDNLTTIIMGMGGNKGNFPRGLSLTGLPKGKLQDPLAA